MRGNHGRPDVLLLGFSVPPRSRDMTRRTNRECGKVRSLLYSPLFHTPFSFRPAIPLAAAFIPVMSTPFFYFYCRRHAAIQISPAPPSGSRRFLYLGTHRET